MQLRLCVICNVPIAYNPRKGMKNYEQRKYCSSACSKVGVPKKQSTPHPERLKQCETCGAIIAKEPNRNWNEYTKKRFCSKKCSAAAQSQKVTCTCVKCGKVFERSPALVRGDIVYCSQACRQNKREYTCEVCGKVFIKRPSERIRSNHIYCGTKCQGIAKRKNKEQDHGRRSPEDLAWKAEVFKRDNYTCQHCGSKKELEAHHIKAVKDYPELRHDVSNGLTLCHQCHYYGVHNGMPNFIHGRYSKRHLKNLLPPTLV
jgi:hypothetical protein